MWNCELEKGLTLHQQLIPPSSQYSSSPFCQAVYDQKIYCWAGPPSPLLPADISHSLHTPNVKSNLYRQRFWDIEDIQKNDNSTDSYLF